MLRTRPITAYVLSAIIAVLTVVAAAGGGYSSQICTGTPLSQPRPGGGPTWRGCQYSTGLQSKGGVI